VRARDAQTLQREIESRNRQDFPLILDGAISDVTAVGSEDNVRDSITTASGTTHEAASGLAQPLGTSSPFYSAL
jgi:hypothetical protein